METEGRRMRTSGFKMAIEEIVKLIEAKGPLTTSEIKPLLDDIPRLKNTRISHNRIGQRLRKRPFIVIERRKNGTKVYALEE